MTLSYTTKEGEEDLLATATAQVKQITTLVEKEKEKPQAKQASVHVPVMADQLQQQDDDSQTVQKQPDTTLSSYLGLSFSLFLALLPDNALTLLPALRSQVSDLTLRLFHAEEQLRQMRSRRKEDSKANARVVEIFASHRNAWQAEERRLLHRLDLAAEEASELRARVAELERVGAEAKAHVEDLEREREEIAELGLGFGGFGGAEEEIAAVERASLGDMNDDFGAHPPQMYRQYLHHQMGNGLSSDQYLASASKFWSDRPNLWQDSMHYESQETMYNTKQFVARREYPWKIDGKSTIPSKLKLLEDELTNLEKVGKGELSKVPSLMRKQAKRYQGLAGKIDDLCRRMEGSDPCEATLSSEFRTQRQTEFLLEAFRLQQRASETGQKLTALHSEVGKSYHKEEVGSEATMESIRNNLKEVQRKLEIWLARIIGDLEGILARDGASRVTEYYVSQNPFFPH